MKAEDCVKLISRRAQVSYLTNQITKFEIVFTKNISISVAYWPTIQTVLFFFAQEVCRGYQITYPSASVQPTLKPTATQKQQDEWELGVLKELFHWLIPVQVELYKQLNHAY